MSFFGIISGYTRLPAVYISRWIRAKMSFSGKFKNPTKKIELIFGFLAENWPRNPLKIIQNSGFKGGLFKAYNGRFKAYNGRIAIQV